ncbi:MAG: 4'-phosphopantetheinyl transferase superfamily protein [Spirochaetaceae bacterium]|nr:MAG: 4'-phosphopantetheinyl transferase superfamily protein [Spirochaetaceae bacterium]
MINKIFCFLNRLDIINPAFRDKVDIFWFDVRKLKPFKDMFSRIVSVGEQEKIDKYYFEIDRDRGLACKVMLRFILSDYLGAAPEDIRFGYGEHGKPFALESGETRRINFNLSHAGDIVLTGIARGMEIGVDVETVRDIADTEMLGILSAFGIPEAIELLTVTEPEEKKRLFFKWWTRKEAVAKMRGTGIATMETLEPGTAPALYSGTISSEETQYSYSVAIP